MTLSHRNTRQGKQKIGASGLQIDNFLNKKSRDTSELGNIVSRQSHSIGASDGGNLAMREKNNAGAMHLHRVIEFQSQLENGMIQVPTECGLLDGQDVRVLILVNEVAAKQTVPSADRHSIWKRTEGAWQGELVREAQGEYPTRLEIE